MELSNTTNALLSVIEARIKSVLDEVSGMRLSMEDEAKVLPCVFDHLNLVRDRLGRLTERLEALPKEAVAEAVAPGVLATIENIRRALELIGQKTEAAIGGSEHGIVQLTESGLSAISAARAGMDASAKEASSLLAEVRRAVGAVQQAGIEAGKASCAAAATAATRYETAAGEMLAAAAGATKSARRTTAAGVVIALLALGGIWAWRDGPNGSSALTRWATSPAGRAAYAFAQANPRGVPLLAACDIPSWHRITFRGRPACKVATTKAGIPVGWYLPEARQ